MIEAGVDIVLGTDAGAVPNHPFGYTGHRELEIYVRLGMSPMQALVAATSNAAKHLGLNDMGMLSPGYSADFIILDETLWMKFETREQSVVSICQVKK